MATLHGTQVIDDKQLSFFVGWLGALFPILLIASAHRHPGHCSVALDSLSAYYGCDGLPRNFFVGALSAIGVFLFSYIGYPAATGLPLLTEARAAKAAGLSAVGVAFFPVMSHKLPHYVCASVLFLLLAFFAWQFGRRERGLRRGLFYLCGAGILGNTLLSGIVVRWGEGVIWAYESAAIMLFGLAWLLNSRFHQWPSVQHGVDIAKRHVQAVVSPIRRWFASAATGMPPPPPPTSAPRARKTSSRTTRSRKGRRRTK